MTSPSVAKVQGPVGLLALLLLSLLVWPAPAAADPSSAMGGVVPVVARPLGSVSASEGAIVATLEPEEFAIPVDSPYVFRARVEVDGDADIVQMRFRVLNPSGKLMLQRTVVQSEVTTGQALATFTRELSDLGLEPGAYPVELDVRVVQGSVVSETTLGSELLLYDPEGPRVPVVFAARVSGQPLADPNGRFVADPARYTRARDDARAIAEWVLEEPEAKVTLAVSPLLLEEWKRISEGYVLTGPEGDASVPATSAVPIAYGQALDTLLRATATGRLELASMGYSDPNLADLSLQALQSDVAPQYAYGRSAFFASLEATPTTGTVVAGGCIPPESVDELTEEGVSYGIVSAACARSGDGAATPGAYAVKNSTLVVLVADSRAEKALASGDADRIARLTLDRRVRGAIRPVVIRATVGPGQMSVAELRAAADAVRSLRWTRPALGNEVAAGKLSRTVTLRVGRGSLRAPAEYWDDVRSARDWAGALAAGYGTDKPETVTARRDSLIAQCSAWAGPTQDWALSDRGRAFAANAERLGKKVFGGVKLGVKPVTLAGASGAVPVTIANDSESPLVLRITLTPSREVTVEGDRTTTMEVLPRDNFVEVPVTLNDSLSGRLTVTVSAGTKVLQSESVTIRASYLDRLVMIVGVVLVLGALLAFIIKRVRDAERAGTNISDDDLVDDEVSGGR